MTRAMSATVVGWIVHAELARTPIGPRRTGIQAPTLKAALLVLHAHEGRPLPLWRLADLLGCGMSSANRATMALIALGLVEPSWHGRRGKRTKSYAINLERLRELQPRQGVGSGAA